MGACPPCQSAQQGTPHSSSAAPLECFPRAWLPFLRSSPKLTVLYFVRPVPVVQYSRDSRGLDHHLWPPPYCESSVALATLISRWHPPNTGMTDMSAAVMSAPHAREIRLLGKSALPCCRACCSLHGSATHTHTHPHTPATAHRGGQCALMWHLRPQGPADRVHAAFPSRLRRSTPNY